jgi:hypothetical protein
MLLLYLSNSFIRLLKADVLERQMVTKKEHPRSAPALLFTFYSPLELQRLTTRSRLHPHHAEVAIYINYVSGVTPSTIPQERSV